MTISVRKFAFVLAVVSVAGCGGDDSAGDVPPVTTAAVDTTAATTTPATTTPATTAVATTPATTAVATTAAPTTAVAPTTTTAAPPPPTTTTSPAPTTTAAPPPAPTTTTCHVVGFGDTARRGDCGDGVRFIQERLTVLGFTVGIDGQFGPGTEAAVKQFQTSRGLTADGIVGPNTWEKLVEGGIGD